MATPWMIYGANGYTGRLIAEEARRRGMTPVLAGRSRAALEELGRALKLEIRVFACENSEVIAANIGDQFLVLHCAGPFSATSQPMVEACLRSRVHYLDITGEIPVFERIMKRNEDCKKAGIVAIPGVGFDVVPSDGLAALLKAKMPDAHTLKMALRPAGTISPGTAKTMIEGIAAGGVVRIEGKLTSVSAVYKTREVIFDKKPKMTVTIPWGDVSTAFHSTGIPNIEFYTTASPGMLRLLWAKKYLALVLARPWAQRALKKLIEKRVHGPSAEQRATARYLLWGEVTNSRNEKIELRMSCPEGYALTQDSAIEAVIRVLAGTVEPGAKTPSLAFGKEFALGLKGVQLC